MKYPATVVFFGRYLAICLILAITGCESSADITPAQHIEKAQAFIDANDFNAGIIELKNALQKDANLPEARWLLGKTYLELGDAAAARKEFANAQSLGFTHPDFELFNLRARLLRGEFQTVLDRINSLSETEKNSAGILVIQGNARLGQGDRLGAMKSFIQAKNTATTSADPLAGLARLAYINGQQQKATEYIDSALALEPDNIEVWNLKGRGALFRNDAAAAEEAFFRASELSEYNLTAKFGLIRAQLAQDKFAESIKHIEKIEARYPKHPTAKYFRAYIAQQKNDLEKAKDYLLAALRFQPTHPESLLMLSRMLYNEGQLNQANQYITTFLADNPDNLSAIKLKTAALVRLNQPDEAITLLESATKKYPGDSKLLALLGMTYVKTGNPERGIETLEKAVSRTGEDKAEMKTQLAIARLASGATDMAISELESAIELEPDFINADILLILSNIRSGRYEAALQASENFIDKAPQNPMPHNLMGAVYVGMEKPALARKKFEQALNLDANYIPALSNMARLDMREGNREQAEQRYQRILAIDQNNTNALIQMARLEAERENSEKLHEYLFRARQSDASAVEPRILLGRYYLKTGQPTRLLEVTSEAFKLSPDSPDVLLLHGQALRLNGDTLNSMKVLEGLVENLPNSANAVFQLGLTQFQAGNQKNAGESFNKALELEPNHTGALNAAAKLALQENDVNAAQDYANRLEAAQPHSAESHTLAGDIFLTKNNPEAAIVEYEKALALTNSSQLMTRLATAYKQSGRQDKAIDIMYRWINKNPEDVMINLLLARTYQDENQIEDARKIYEKILNELDPDNVIALNNLAWLSINTDLDYAYKLAMKAKSLAPKHVEILDTLGWILVQQGYIERGMAELQAAKNIEPDSPEIRYHIAAALAEAGEREKALAELDPVIKSDIKFFERAEAEQLFDSLK